MIINQYIEISIKKIIIVLVGGCLCISCISYGQSQSNQIYTVSQLIENISSLEGNNITVKGYVTLGFENCAIWESEKAYSDKDIKKAIWLRLPNESCYGLSSHENRNESFMQLTGVVDNEDCGHLCLFNGALKEIVFNE